jgi:aminoglycoside 2''-adenylyltransferase
MNAAHLELLFELLAAADARQLPLWLESGWAIDARLGRITREHEDIDLAFPAERETEFRELLRAFGGNDFEKMDYGFLVTVRGVLLDCEPCERLGDVYELGDGIPAGSCPWTTEGTLAGVAVRCTSWAAIIWDYFYYLEEVPQAQWRPKDFDSYALVRATLGETAVRELRAAFDARPDSRIG